MKNEYKLGIKHGVITIYVAAGLLNAVASKASRTGMSGAGQETRPIITKWHWVANLPHMTEEQL